MLRSIHERIYVCFVTVLICLHPISTLGVRSFTLTLVGRPMDPGLGPREGGSGTRAGRAGSAGRVGASQEKLKSYEIQSYT
jgi:hypothetical protein